MQTRVFIVHMLPARAARFFARASATGMMTEGYVWIVTDNVGTSLDVLPEHTIETMQGVVSFRPYVAKSVRTTDFTARFVTQFIAKYHQYTDVRMARPTVYQYWAYDVACAVAIATEKLKRVRFSNLGFQTLEGEGKRLLDGLVPTPAGPKLLRSILEAEFDGLAGRFRLVDRHLQIPIYEVVNLIGEKARGIGFWSPGSGLLRLLNSSNCQSGAICSMSTGKALKPVIWPGDSITVPKGWDFPVNGKILRIGVPVRREFKFFVNVENNPNTNTSSISGYSIDVFDAAVKKLPYALRYQYIPYDCANSYELLVSQVFFKNLDAAVGDVTIVANRTRYVDFTMPYTESGVSMLVLAKNDGKLSTWIFLEPLTKGLWIVTLLFLFATGLLVWLIEHPTNVEFQGSKLRQFSTVFYFTFSTLTFSHDQIIKKLRSKVLVVIWCFVVLVLVQTYTASLSSLLTARRLQPSVTDPWQLLRNGDCVGYQNGSFVQARLKQIGFGEHKIKVFSTLEQYANALRAGSKHGGVSAIFDEVPYLNSFLTQYGQEFKIVGPVDRTNGFGFVFPKGSPMVPDLSKAILNLREGSEGLEIENKWFGDATLPLHHDNPDTDFAHLTLRSFKGLFIINGITLGVTLLITLPKFIRARNTEPINASSQSAFESGETASNNEPEPLPDGTAEDSAPAESPPE
ncbi:unnamed protein product [Urochloa decumbens]|uniref:Ionotropic glutamate receptor C-terminal domain-containing protein n=1 Tax=Urochloa decumbens TaxID=240449 RepID=A0ABC9E817_9POAL